MEPMSASVREGIMLGIQARFLDLGLYIAFYRYRV